MNRLCYNGFMDNKAYLDQIAVKTKVKSGPVITPMLIKLIAAGVIMLITMIIVGSVISSSNAKVTQTFERVYLRINKLSDASGPLAKYTKDLRDPNLKSYATNLLSILTTMKADVGSVISSTGVNPSGISSAITTAETGNMTAYSSALENAKLSGTIDRVFATETSYQLITLIQYENESLKKTNSQQYANIINKSAQDLSIIQQQIEEWSSTY